MEDCKKHGSNLNNLVDVHAGMAAEVEFTDHSSRDVSSDLSIVNKVYSGNSGLIVDKDVILHVFIWWETHSNQCGNSN